MVIYFCHSAQFRKSFKVKKMNAQVEFYLVMDKK